MICHNCKEEVLEGTVVDHLDNKCTAPSIELALSKNPVDRLEFLKREMIAGLASPMNGSEVVRLTEKINGEVERIKALLADRRRITDDPLAAQRNPAYEKRFHHVRIVEPTDRIKLGCQVYLDGIQIKGMRSYEYKNDMGSMRVVIEIIPDEVVMEKSEEIDQKKLFPSWAFGKEEIEKS